MRAVLDTNTLISAVISTGTSHEVLVRGFEGECEVLVSSETVQEFEDTLLKYDGKFQLSRGEIREEVETVEYFGEFVLPEHNIDEHVFYTPQTVDGFTTVSIPQLIDYHGAE